MIIGAVVILPLLFPRYGCALATLIIIAGLLFLTENGAIAIVGLVAVGIVYLFVKFRAAGDINLNVEGDGNNITINR